MTATDLLAAGIVDAIVPEYDDASDEPDAFCRRVGAAIEAAISRLRALPEEARLAARAARYRPA